MCYLTRLSKILACVFLFHSAVLAQSTGSDIDEGSDIYETAWAVGNAVNNYDVIYVNSAKYTPPHQSRVIDNKYGSFGGDITAELEIRCRIVFDKATESCVLVEEQIRTDDKSNKIINALRILHYKDKKLTRWRAGLESPIIKNYERFDDFLFDNSIPLVERPLHYYFPTTLVNRTLDEHLENFRKVYSAAKVELLPDGKQLLKWGKEELKYGNGQYRAEVTYDPTKFVFTQIKSIELGDKFPNGVRINCLIKPKYESVGELFRLTEVEYEGLDGTGNPANPVDLIGKVRFEWKGFNEDVVQMPTVIDLLIDTNLPRFLEGKELE